VAATVNTRIPLRLRSDEIAFDAYGQQIQTRVDWTTDRTLVEARLKSRAAEAPTLGLDMRL
jgi:hypothetical protein